MSANRKKAKRSSSPDTLSTQGSVWLSPSGLPPELLLEGPTTEVVTETPILQVPVKKELPALERLEGDGESNTSSPLTLPDAATEAKTFCFKDQHFVHSSKGLGGGRRTKVWKSLKQIVANDKALPWGEDDVTYGSIEAPPSFKPAKKYSDLSGLHAKYTDPHTKLRYATSDEFARIRVLPSDIVSGYLGLRKANLVVP